MTQNSHKISNCYKIIPHVYLSSHRYLIITQHCTLCKLIKSFSNIVTSFGRNLFETKILLDTKINDLFLTNHSFLLSWLNQIQFIGYDHFGQFIFDFFFDLIEPYFKILKTFPFCNIEHDDSPVASSIVWSGDGHVLFCSCWTRKKIHVSQMLILMSLEPTLKLIGAY